VAFVTARGGNYLLNLGPRGDGSIVEFEADMLRGIGQWMGANDEAIFGADPEPWLRLDFGYATSRPGRLYLFVKDFPADGVLRVPGWTAQTPRAHLLAEPAGQGLECALENQTLTIRLSKAQEDPNLTVLAVDHAGPRPFLPADIVRLTPGQRVTLLATNGLPWHRIVGEDYYSQHQEVVAREWNLLPTATQDWTVIVHRTGAHEAKGYLLTLGAASCQFILPTSGDELARECARVNLAAGEPARLTLQAISPGAELAEKNLSLELAAVHGKR
jgi:alpha-L-fucosidase